jgi:signal transduction histidine kinase
VTVAASAAVVPDERGEPAVARWLLRNVTERLRSEEALRSLNAELEARFEERTRELADRTTEMEAASRAKSELLATMSHELRTPINAIVGYTQLLDMGLAGPVTDAQREYLDRLGASSEHLLALVNDVLDLARVEAGRMPVARERGTVARVVEAALALTLPDAEAKGVRLVGESPDLAPVAYVGDDNRVRQIVVNLLSNAIKFTPPGGTVTVTSGGVAETPPDVRVGGGGPWALIRVADTGIGIAPEHQSGIFEPFMQVEGGEHGPYRRTQGGTGLGLAVSRRLARLMGGDLTVASSVGRGATFTLWLPATDGGEGVAERGARALRESGEYRVHGLGEVGEDLRERVEEVLEAYAARLRSEPSLPGASELRRSDLEDHQLAFLADLAQSLVVIGETGGLASHLLRDGSTIQRVIAELHGSTRHRQGWTDEQLAREYAILAEELEALVRRRVPDGAGDVSTALDVLRRLVARATATGRRALRHARQAQEPSGE